MENFGLITIEHKRFPINEMFTTDEKFYTFTLIAHEIAHQWFGDIVTLKKWSDLWLNEAFAEYFQYHSIQDYFKDTLDRFYFNEFVMAFEADSSWFTHSIAGHDQNTPNLFDDVTYNKGAVIISMISQYTDNSQFLKICGNLCALLRIYLNDYAFDNANTRNLLGVLGIDISTFIYSWIYQPGFPVIDVHSTLKNSSLLVNLKQKRFNLLNKESESLWNISLEMKIFETYSNGSVQNVNFKRIIFDQHEYEFSLDRNRKFLINSGSAGLYFTNYGNQFADLLSIMSINPSSFSGLEKAHFVYQAFQLSLSLQISWKDAISTLNLLDSNTHPSVWKMILNLWFKLQGYLKDDPTFVIFKDTVKEKIPRLNLIWPDPSIMFLGVLTGSSDYMNESLKIFSSWNSSKPISISPEYLDAIYYACLTVKSNFEVLWSLDVKFPGDVLRALTLSQYPSHQKRVFFLMKERMDRYLYYEYLLTYSPSSYKLFFKYADISIFKAKFVGIVTSRLSGKKLVEIQEMISDENGNWENPSPNEPPLFKLLRSGVEKAISIMNFRLVSP